MPRIFLRGLPAVLVLLACARPATSPAGGEVPMFRPEVRPDPSPAVLPGSAASPPVSPSAGLPEVPLVRGPLRVNVIYPPAGAVLAVGDSTFLLGSVGTGTAALRINGSPVQVHPNGAWLAWVPVDRAPAPNFLLEATLGNDTVRMNHPVRRSPRYRPPTQGPWIDTTAFQPSGEVWWPRDEYLPLSVRAAEGAAVAIVLPGGRRVSLSATSTHSEIAAGIRAFDRDTLNLDRAVQADRHQALIRGVSLGLMPAALLPDGPAPSGGTPLVVEAVLGGDTTRAIWPLRLALLDSLPVAVEIDDDPPRTGTTDRQSPGRARPGATYHWFFPNGTQATVAGRINGDFRLALAPGEHAWVAAADVRSLAGGIASAPATVGSVTVTPRTGFVELRIPVSRQIPFFIDEEERRLRLTLYHAAGDLNWIRYGASDDRLLTLIRWRQAGPNVEVDLDLNALVWGYRTRWDRGDLVLDIRRPPEIDTAAPLRGRLIAVDAGHPPGGSTGPTGLTEAEANLPIAERIAAQLEAAGARVIMTRRDARPVELWTRVVTADTSDAELLVSVHNNALPDGVNPFTNHGASVFYNHPRSLPLARLVQRAMVMRTGLRDLGAARGDLALARPTWMPAVLVEGMFMIVPEQEAALRSVDGQQRYAEAVVAGIHDFLLWRSEGTRTSPR